MKFAIVESGGKQFRAVEGGTLEVDRLPLETGANVKLERVLLLADGETISVGTPLVKDTPIWTTVLEHFKGPKVNTFNYSPKKRIRVKIGHRQNYTRLLVEQIGGATWVKKEPVKVEKVVEVETGKVEKTSRTTPKVSAKAAETKAAAVKATPKAEGKASPKAAKPAAGKPADKAPAKAGSKASPKPAKEKKPAASSKKTSSAKAEPRKKTPAAPPKGKKPAAK